jgi:hypothetical protein
MSRTYEGSGHLRVVDLTSRRCCGRLAITAQQKFCTTVRMFRKALMVRAGIRSEPVQTSGMDRSSGGLQREIFSQLYTFTRPGSDDPGLRPSRRQRSLAFTLIRGSVRNGLRRGHQGREVRWTSRIRPVVMQKHIVREGPRGLFIFAL